MKNGLTQSQREEQRKRSDEDYGYIATNHAEWREHRYVGGPPPKRIYTMQINHEVRARQLGIVWDIVDLRKVYAHWKGLCGICGLPVSLETFTIDHIIPTSRGGPHVFENLQPAHRACNSAKGDT